MLFVWSNPSSLPPLYSSNPHLDSLSPNISLSNFIESNLLCEFPDGGLISPSPSSGLSLLSEWSQCRDSSPQRRFTCAFALNPQMLCRLVPKFQLPFSPIILIAKPLVQRRGRPFRLPAKRLDAVWVETGQHLLSYEVIHQGRSVTRPREQSSGRWVPLKPLYRVRRNNYLINEIMNFPFPEFPPLPK